MKADRVLSYWYMGVAAAGAVVAAVAALLLAIIATARSIHSNAERIIAVANDIVANTSAIPRLADTDAGAAKLASGARSIEQHASELADALSAPRTGARE